MRRCRQSIIFSVVIIFLGLCSIVCAKTIREELDGYTTRYYANPKPQKAAPLLEKFLKSEYFNNDHFSSYYFNERMGYFFARIGGDNPEVLSDYLNILENGNHQQRLCMIDIVAFGGNKEVEEYLKNKIQAGRYNKEREQIEYYLWRGIPVDFDILTEDVNETEDPGYLIAEFMFSGNGKAIEKIVDFLTDPNGMQVEPNELESYCEYVKRIVSRYGKKDKRVLRLCKSWLESADVRKKDILEDIIDQIDGSITIAKLIKQGKNEQPVAGPKGWALGASAVLIECNFDRHNYLSTRPLTRINILKKREIVKEWWGFDDYDSLIGGLNWLIEEGHRKSFEQRGQYMQSLSEDDYQQLLKTYSSKPEMTQEFKITRQYYEQLGEKSILGWDLSRYICLCRWGYLCGYMSEEEAWEKIMPVARRLQKTFDSWADLGQNYLIGRQFWSHKESQEGERAFNDAYQRLMEMKLSPWNIYPWDMDLGVPDEVADVNEQGDLL